MDQESAGQDVDASKTGAAITKSITYLVKHSKQLNSIPVYQILYTIISCQIMLCNITSICYIILSC